MDIDEKHRYAASALMGVSLLGEGSLLLSLSSVTVFYASMIGGVAGVYIYGYSR